MSERIFFRVSGHRRHFHVNQNRSRSSSDAPTSASTLTGARRRRMSRLLAIFYALLKDANFPGTSRGRCSAAPACLGAYTTLTANDLLAERIRARRVFAAPTRIRAAHSIAKRTACPRDGHGAPPCRRSRDRRAHRAFFITRRNAKMPTADLLTGAQVHEKNAWSSAACSPKTPPTPPPGRVNQKEFSIYPRVRFALIHATASPFKAFSIFE